MKACQDAVKMAANSAITYAKEHPYALGFQVASIAVGFAPAIVTAPVLGVIGFSPAGVAAGWFPPTYRFLACLPKYLPVY